MAYADYIVLLPPSPAAMRQMLQICDEYANEHSIVFNGSKSKCLIFEPRKLSQFVHTLHRDMRQFVIGGKDIKFVDTFVHLGHVIRSDMDDNDDNIEQTNNVLCYFGKLVSDVKYSLFESYPSSMYGSELWYVGDKCVNKFCTVWRKGVRRIWNLPYDAHCVIFTDLSGGMAMSDELCKRSLNFIAKCLCHSSELILSLIHI